jgi:voltage-gated potassium channel
MYKRKIELDFLYSFLVIIAIITIGAVFYHFNENLSWLDSSYFTVMTILTVGYGDFTPTSPASKAFTMVYALVSIPSILFCLGLIINDFIKERIDQIEDKFNQIIQNKHISRK